MITTKDSNLRILNKGDTNIKKSVNIIDSWESFKRSIVVYAEGVIKFAKKNVKLRYITDEPKDRETAPKILQTLKKKGWVELRHVPTKPLSSIRICDGKYVTLSIISGRTSLEEPSLFSDNPCIVAILQDYFELLWSKATEDSV